MKILVSRDDRFYPIGVDGCCSDIINSQPHGSPLEAVLCVSEISVGL